MKSAFVRLFSTAAVCFFANGLLAYWTWNGGNDADIADSGNWTGSDGNYLFNASASGLYLSRDWTCATNMHLTASGKTVSFDLGKDRTLTFGEKTQYWFDTNNSVVEFLSGTLENSGNEMVLLSSGSWGTQRNFNTFRLKGSGTVFRGNAIHSYHGASNTLEITDGALFSGALRFGNNNPKYQVIYVHDGAVMTNTGSQAGGTASVGLRMTVDNAMFVCSGNELSVKGVEAKFEFLNGSTASVPSKTFLLGNGSSSVSNKLVVSGGSNLSSSSLRIGVTGSSCNEAVITGGSTFVDAGYGLYVGGLGSDGSGVSNVVTIADGATVSVTQYSSGHQSLCVGYNGGWNELTIGGNASLTNGASGTPFVGYASSNNKIIVDGGRLYSGRCLVLGSERGADSNLLYVANGRFQGGTYYGTFQVGGKGSHNLLEIAEGGLVELKTSNDWSGRYGNGSDNSYVGREDGSSFNAIRVRNGGALRCPSTYGIDPNWGKGKINIGFGRNTCSNRLEVLAGSANIGCVYIGGTNETSVGNAMVVSNGNVKVRYLYVSQTNSLPEGVSFAGANIFEIAGTNSVVKSQTQMRFYADAELSLDFSEGFYKEIPLLAESGTMQFDAGSSVSLKNIEDVCSSGGATVTIARCSAGAITIEDGTIEAWNASLAADPKTAGCVFSLANDGKDLVLKISKFTGFIFTVR